MKTAARFLQLQSMLGWLAIFIIGPLYFIALKAMGYRVRDLKRIRQEYSLELKRHQGPWIICANHLTMIDSAILVYATISLYAHLRHYRAIPWNLPERDNFQRNILLSIFCYLGKCIPVNRGGDRAEMKKTLDKCAYILSRKQNLMIFPEGTRSRTGQVNTKDFSYGVGRFIKDFPDCKVICLYLRGKAKIEGILTETTLVFEKTYTHHDHYSTASLPIKYSFEKNGNIWRGGFTLQKKEGKTRGLAECVISPAINDAFGIVVGPIRR